MHNYTEKLSQKTYSQCICYSTPGQ